MRVRSVQVRPATAEDLPTLLALADELREQVPGEAAARGRGTTRGVLTDRYAEALTDPDRTLVLAVRDGDPEEHLGMALLHVAPANALVDVPAVHLSHCVVADRHRRKGAGKALVAAALAFAEDRGIEQLVVSVNPGSRESNRFYARLGLAPLAVRRTAPVALVRRRLAAEDVGPEAVGRLRRPVRLPSATIRKARAQGLGPRS